VDGKKLGSDEQSPGTRYQCCSAPINSNRRATSVESLRTNVLPLRNTLEMNDLQTSASKIHTLSSHESSMDLHFFATLGVREKREKLPIVAFRDN
jgi:hypothetical protein